MKKEKDKKTYTVGLVRGLVHRGDVRRRGEILEDIDVNEAGIYTSCNRAVLLEDADDVAAFKAMIAEEDKALKKAG